MSGALIGGGLLLLMVGLYLGTYLLNKTIPVPEGTVVIDKCSTCGSGACSLPVKEEFSKSNKESCEIYEESRVD